MAPAGVYVEAARQATRTLPIAFALVPNPVARGLARSLARPGGTITELAAKRVELLREALPGQSRLGALTIPGAAALGETERAAKALVIRLEVASVTTPGRSTARSRRLLAAGPPR